MGGENVDSAVTAVFSALVWQTQQLRDEMEKYSKHCLFYLWRCKAISLLRMLCPCKIIWAVTQQKLFYYMCGQPKLRSAHMSIIKVRLNQAPLSIFFQRRFLAKVLSTGFQMRLANSCPEATEDTCKFLSTDFQMGLANSCPQAFRCGY